MCPYEHEIMALESPAHEPVKKLQSKSFPFAVCMQTLDLQRTMTRVGTTPTVVVHPASRELARPIHRSITRHSAIQVVSQNRSACGRQTRHPATALKTKISSQLVLSVSESPSTVAVDVPTRATIDIAVQPNLANGSHIARSCPK